MFIKLLFFVYYVYLSLINNFIGVGVLYERFLNAANQLIGSIPKVLGLVLVPFVIFYFQELIKGTSSDRVLFKKLSLDLKKVLMDLICIQRSFTLFIDYASRFSKQMKTISFPVYNISFDAEIIPYVLFHRSNDLLRDLEEIQMIVYALDNDLKQNYINTVADRIINGSLSFEEAKELYEIEAKFAKERLEYMSKHIDYVVKTLAKISLINSRNEFYSFIIINLNYTQDELSSEIEKIKQEYNSKVVVLDESQLRNQ